MRRCVIVFGKCKKPCKGTLGRRRKLEAARFGHLLRSGILQYILVLNSETEFYDTHGGSRYMKVSFKVRGNDKNKNRWYIRPMVRTIDKSINSHLFIDNSSQGN